jgi:hypothetical protein
MTKIDIAARLRTLPYAYLNALDVEVMVRLLDAPNGVRVVADTLRGDAATHALSDNWIKAEMVGGFADQIDPL